MRIIKDLSDKIIVEIDRNNIPSLDELKNFIEFISAKGGFKLYVRMFNLGHTEWTELPAVFENKVSARDFIGDKFIEYEWDCRSACYKFTFPQWTHEYRFKLLEAEPQKEMEFEIRYVKI